MEIAISEPQLTDLIRRANAGEEVILTGPGEAAVRLEPVKREAKKNLTPEERYKLIMEISKHAAAEVLPGPCAARSQDFLYDENGLPA